MRHNGRTAHLDCAYLYQDGHLVEVWARSNYVGNKRLNDTKYVVVREKFCNSGPKGRLVFHWCGLGFLPAFKGADMVEAAEATLEHGSDNSKARGLAVGHVGWRTAQGWTGNFPTFDGIISGPFTYQPDIAETFAEVVEAGSWCEYPVVKVIRANGSKANE